MILELQILDCTVGSCNRPARRVEPRASVRRDKRERQTSWRLAWRHVRGDSPQEGAIIGRINPNWQPWARQAVCD